MVVAQIRWIARSTSISHSRTVRSALPLARVRPSGLNATELTELVWPVRGGPRGPNISSLSRARTKLGPDAVRFLFEEVTGPVGAPQAPGVWCCGLRMVSMDGSSTDVPVTPANRAAFSGPSNDKRD